MMANKFSVETQSLKKSSQVIEDKTARYDAEVAKLYAEIANLRIEWQGQSSDTFNEKIEGYRNDFDELAKILREYSTFLRNTADRYEKTENSINDAASGLNIGR